MNLKTSLQSKLGMLDIETGRFADAELVDRLRPFKIAKGMSWSNGEHVHWVFASLSGNAVGCCSLLLKNGDARFKSAVVLPPYRNMGVYRQLVDLRLQLARDLGAINCSTYAGEMSIHQLLKDGFVAQGQPNAAGATYMKMSLTNSKDLV